MNRTRTLVLCALAAGMTACNPAENNGTPVGNENTTSQSNAAPQNNAAPQDNAAPKPEKADVLKLNASGAIVVAARIPNKITRWDEEPGYPDLYHIELTLPQGIEIPAPWSGSFDLTTFQTDTGRNLTPEGGFRTGMGNSIRWSELHWDEAKRTIKIPFQGEVVDRTSKTLTLEGSFQLAYPQETKTIVVDDVLTKDKFEVGTFGNCKLVVRRPGKEGMWLMAPNGFGNQVKEVRIKAKDGSVIARNMLAEVRAEIGVINLIILPTHEDFPEGISLEIDVAEEVKIVNLAFAIENMDINSIGK